MTNPSDSFIDEVTEEVRRERLYGWLRRWGWAIGGAALLLVLLAGWVEWRQSQARAAAMLRGEVLLTALEVEDPQARLQALAEVPREGEEGAIPALLLAAEQAAGGDGAAAAATLEAVATDGDVPPLYRDLAALKAQMARGAEADPAALEALAAPGAPFAALAREQLALLHLAAGRRDEALAGLRAILEDAGTEAAQTTRVEALAEALDGVPAPAAEEAPAAEPPAGPAPEAAP